MKETNRERQSEIKYNISLNEEQKEAKRIILENEINIVTGNPGSGKTLLASAIALDLSNKKQISKILLLRPAVEVGRSLGFLPGNLEEKIDPYFEAFMDCMRQCVSGSMKIPEDKIKTLPLQFIRGLTFSADTLVVCDEMQNSTITEMMAILSRVGRGSKLIILGDNGQQDTKEAVTGLKFVMDASVSIPTIKLIKLKANHRSAFVDEIWSYYNNKFTNK